MGKVLDIDRGQSAVIEHAQSFCREVGCTLEEYFAMVESAHRLWPLLSAAIKNPRLLDRPDVRRVFGLKRRGEGG